MTNVTDSPLFRQIIENPGDRDLRLVFADWLEEQGDPRGQLIRFQIQLEGMSRFEKGYSTLKTKERKSLKEHGAFGVLPKSFSASCEVGAGCVERIEITPTRFLKHAVEIFQTAPVIHVRLKGSSKRFAKLAELPQLGQLQSLVLKQSKIDDNALAALVNSPHLRDLETLEVHSDELTDPGRILGQTALIQRLRQLRLTGRSLNDRDVQLAVASAVDLRSVEFGYAVTDASLEALGTAAGLRSLESLECQMGWQAEGLSAKGLMAFGNAEFDAPLKSLTIRPVVRGFASALGGPRYQALERLAINWTEVATEDIASIAEHLPHLRELRLTETRIRDAAARALARSPILRSLRKLYLTGNGITRRGVEALLDSEYFTPDTEFYLGNNNLNRHDIAAIRERAGKSFGNLSRDARWAW